MNETVIQFDRHQHNTDEKCQERILNSKRNLKDSLIILGHHYQNESVYRHADYTGDSLKLAQYTQALDAKYIIFLGVHFMAEVSNILSRSDQVTILPDLSAGCQMADMADLQKVERSYRELNKSLILTKPLRQLPILIQLLILKPFVAIMMGLFAPLLMPQKF